MFNNSLYTQFSETDIQSFDLLHFLNLLGVGTANVLLMFDEEII